MVGADDVKYTDHKVATPAYCSGFYFYGDGHSIYGKNKKDIPDIFYYAFVSSGFQCKQVAGICSCGRHHCRIHRRNYPTAYIA